MLTLAISLTLLAQPNVLILIADDQRPDAIHALGSEQIITPNLDRLVVDGATFTRAYCRGSDSGAVCAPSRAMLLAGRDYLNLPKGFRIPWSGPADQRGICDSPLLPETFRAAGYDTFATGKWHNGRPSFNACFSHADEVFFGGMGSHTELKVHDFDPSGQYAGDHAHTLEAFSSEAFAGAAIDFIKSREEDDAPFLAWVSFTAPHDPRTPPDDVRALYDESAIDLPPNFLAQHPFDNGELDIRDENLAPTPRTPERVKKEIADYRAMITHMDAQIGRILDALDASGLGDDTIVVFLADHGLAIGSHGLLGKQNLYEHSMGAPLIFMLPTRATGGSPASVPSRSSPRATGGSPASAPQRFDDLVYIHDLYPTLCELAGIKIPAEVTTRSLAPLLTGHPERFRQRDELVLAYRDIQRALVTPRWKLISYPEIDRVQLFDLETDPHEIHDRSRDDPARTRRLLDRLIDRLEATGDPVDLSKLVLSLD